MKYLLRSSVIIILALSMISLFDSCKKKPDPPTVTTGEITEITQTSIKTGGTVTSDGGAKLIVAGICWSTSPSPSVKDKHTNDGYDIGPFLTELTGLAPNTLYYVRAYAANSEGIGYGPELSFTTGPVVGATIITEDVTSVTTESAVSGGTVTTDGGGAVTSVGVCWSVNDSPTVADSHTSDGSGIGSFTSQMTGLDPNTTYYIRAYAVNDSGISYGNTLTFTTLQVPDPPITTVSDVDGNVYNSVTIGTQVWMAENLQTTHYNNGDPIITGLNNNDWTNTTSGAYSIYNDDPENIDSYGLLYNWYAVTDNRQLCPAGWHVPSDEEWAILAGYLIANGYGFGGDGNDIAKSMAATAGWNVSSITGTVGNDQADNNSSGFTAVPAGFRNVDGHYSYEGNIGFWWSTSESSDGSLDALLRFLQNTSEMLGGTAYDKNKGLSVRCLKD